MYAQARRSAESTTNLSEKKFVRWLCRGDGRGWRSRGGNAPPYIPAVVQTPTDSAALTRLLCSGSLRVRRDSVSKFFLGTIRTSRALHKGSLVGCRFRQGPYASSRQTYPVVVLSAVFLCNNRWHCDIMMAERQIRWSAGSTQIICNRIF